MSKKTSSKGNKSGKKRAQPKWSHLPPALANKVKGALSEARDYLAKRRKYNAKIS